MDKNARHPALLLRQRPFLLLLPPLIAGIVLQHKLPQVPATAWITATAASGIAAMVLHLQRTVRRAIRIPGILLLLLSFVLLGAACASSADVRADPRWYGHYLSQAEALLVTAEGGPQPKAHTWYIPVKAAYVNTGARWQPATGDINLYLYRGQGPLPVREGQTLLLPASLVPIRPSGNPFSFDYARYAAHKGLYHQAFLSPASIRIVDSGSRRPPVLSAVRDRLRQYAAAGVRDSTTSALVQAIMLNERAQLDRQLWQAYTSTGIVHIIAISGMHVALLAGIVLFLLRLLPSRRLSWLKYLAAAIVVWSYVALTGAPPSAIRAAVMFTLVSAGKLLTRDAPAVNTWAASGFLLLCIRPSWLYDVGIQLSFLAVLSILLFYRDIRKWMVPSSKILLWAWEAVALSMAAQLLVFPLVIYYFHQFPLWNLAASIPAALYSFLLMTGALLLFLLQSAGLSWDWPGQLLTLLTQGFNRLIDALARWTPSCLGRLFIDAGEYWLMMLAITACCWYGYRRKPVLLLAAATLLLLLLAGFIAKDISCLQQERIVVYNVNRHAYADVFRGKTAAPVGYEQDRQGNMAAISAARMGYRATEVPPVRRSPVCRIADAVILYWQDSASVKPRGTFPVDFLIVSNTTRFDPALWYRCFRPRKIIIDGSLPRWKALQWKQRLEAAGAYVHWVQEDGAWVYPAPG